MKNSGFDDLMPEFIQKILSNKDITYDTEVRAWPKDDASFLLLRKIDTKENLPNDNVVSDTEVKIWPKDDALLLRNTDNKENLQNIKDELI